jgi:hypothetical protein
MKDQSGMAIGLSPRRDRKGSQCPGETEGSETASEGAAVAEVPPAVQVEQPAEENTNTQPSPPQAPPETTHIIKEIPFHPVTELFPLLEGPAFESLKKDIQENGQHVAGWLYDGKIIDGRNRYRANRELGRETKFEEWDGQGSLVTFVLSLNQERRHLTESQRAMAAARAKPLFEEEARQRMLAGKSASDPTPRAEEGGKGEAAALAAEQLNVGRNSVYQAQKVLRDGTPELQHAVVSGQVSVTAAADLASLPKEEQAEAVAGGKKALAAKSQEVRQKKRSRSPGKDSQKNPNPGAQPAKNGEKKSLTLELGFGNQKLAEILVEHLGRRRARLIRDEITKILDKGGAKTSK